MNAINQCIPHCYAITKIITDLVWHGQTLGFDRARAKGQLRQTITDYRTHAFT